MVEVGREDELVKTLTHLGAGKYKVETPGTRPSFKVVVATRRVVFFQGRWLLYYGMGDSQIGLAEHRP